MKKITALIGLALLFITVNLSAQSSCSATSEENFDNLSTCGTGCGSACSFVNFWTNSLNDDIDWAVNSGGTSSSSTGPTGDHTTGSGNYLYTETSGCYGDTAILISQPLDLNGFPNFALEFWYHMYGTAMGVLYVEASNDNGATWNALDTLTDNQNLWQLRSLSLNAYLNDTILIQFRGITGTSFTSDMALDDISVKPVYANDAQVTGILAPINPIVAGLNSVDVLIKNLGTANLTSANIGWAVNGVQQADYSWTGNMVTDSSSNAVIGSFNFPTGFSTVEVWNDSANANPDPTATCDTISTIVCTPISGNITVGPSGTFSSFSELSFALNSCGINGTVNISVAPGVYNEEIELNQISGTSASNRIIIDGTDSALVRLVSSSNSTVYLNGADWVIIKNMRLENSGTTNASVVRFSDSADHNLIENCALFMPLSTSSSTAVVALTSSNTSPTSYGTNGNADTIRNCAISGGYYGMRLNGINGTSATGIAVLNNQISNVQYYGIYAYYMDGLTISSNVISNIVNTNGDGMYLLDQMNFTITDNQLIDIPDYGLYVADGNFDFVQSQRGLIANNLIISKSDYALYLDDFENSDVWHNSLYSETTNRAVYFNDLDSVSFQNNMIYSENGYAIYFLDATSTILDFVCDYNLYYTKNGANVARDGTTDYADLSSWQTANASINVNSIETDPVFNPSLLQELRPLSPIANNQGSTSLGITTDVFGVTRGATPDIGAVEFNSLNDDASFLEIIAPVGCGDSLAAVSAVVSNFGGNTISSLAINVSASGPMIATQVLGGTFTVSIPFNTIDTIPLGTINTIAGGALNISGSLNLTGDQNILNDSASSSVAGIIPFSPVGFDVEVCNGDTADLQAMTGLPVTYEWYDSAFGGNLVGNGSSFTVPSIAAQNTYYLAYGALIGSLPITYAAGNGADGNMFDLTTSTSTAVTGFNINSNATVGTSVTVEIYYLPNSSYVGSETNALLWTSAGSYTVTAAGTGNPTPVSLTTPIPLTAGQTTGIYVITLNGGVAYTNGNGTNQTYTDGTLTMTAGAGRGLPVFTGSVFSPRVFNGDILYGGAACSAVRDTVTASVAPSNQAAITVTSPIICNGDSNAVLTASGAAFNAPYNYLWSNNDTTMAASGLGAGSYSVIITGTNGCPDTANTTLTDPAAINFTITQSVDTLTVAEAGATSYQWIDCNNSNAPIVGATSQSLTLPFSGSFAVIVDLNGCVDTSACFSAINTGIDNNAANQSELVIYPNPAKDQLFISRSNDAFVNERIRLFDLSGKVVRDLIVNAKQVQLDLGDLPSGIYFLDLSGERKKIILTD